MAAVTLLAAGAKADTGTGAAVDVSAAGVMRLDATVKCNHGKQPWLTLSIDSGASATGPWFEIYTRTFRSGVVAGSQAWPGNSVQRLSLGGFDLFARVRWAGAAGNVSNNLPTDSTGEFDISVVGVAQ